MTEDRPMNNVPATCGSETPFRAAGRSGSDQAKLYTSPTYFAAEMHVMARQAWHFVGMLSEVQEPNDWLRASVFGVDVFVQNGRTGLRGFRNVCQHRGFPIRREARGNGPIVCGFHAWRYDDEGLLVGVARNQELFGLSREERCGFALAPVRIETAGPLIFATLDTDAPALDHYLGRTGTLLRALSARLGPLRHRWSGETAANWKLAYEVTLDDYHVQFVHPLSIGADAIPAWGFVYEQDGPHSHMMRRRTPDWTFPGFWEDLEGGTYEYAGYKIHHLFPATFLVAQRDSVLITSFSPTATDRTHVDDRIFELVGEPRGDGFWEAAAQIQRQVSDEDRRIVEAQQQAIAGLVRAPTFGALEQRLAWFQEAYEERVGQGARRLIGPDPG